MVVRKRKLWQGYEEDGEQMMDVGLTVRHAATGILHGAVHMWIWRESAGQLQVLLQKRSSKSKTWPGYYDASAGGHIDFGEAPLQAVIRETAEELGIKLDQDEARLLFVHRQKLQDPKAKIIENEIQWVYGYDVTRAPHFQLESSEVDSVVWLGMDELVLLKSGEMAGMRFVPHDEVYFAELVQGLAGFWR